MASSTGDRRMRQDLPANYRKLRKYRNLAELVYREEDICWLCGGEVDKSLPKQHPMSKHMDHIIPVSIGGEPYERDNVRLSHAQCNTRRGNKTPRQTIHKRIEQQMKDEEDRFLKTTSRDW